MKICRENPTERVKESLSRCPYHRVVRALHRIKTYVRNLFFK
jgi:hypothetical protein